MFRKVNSYIYQLSTATGLEISTQHDDRVLCRLVTTTIKNKKIIVAHQHEWAYKEKMALANVSLNHPVTIVCSGKGVLIRETPSAQVDANIIIALFPQLNPDDFYFETIEIEQKAFVAIARKEMIDSYIQKFASVGFKIVNCHLGFSVLSTILPHLPAETFHISTGYYEYKIEKNVFANFKVDTSEKPPQELRFSGQYIIATNIIALAAAVELLADGIDTDIPIQQKQVLLKRAETKDNLLFRLLCRTILAGLFSVLLVNFIVFNHFHSKNQQLELVKLAHQESFATAQNLEHEIALKQHFLDQSGWNNTYSVSFLADRIASLVPSEIKLNSLSFNPPAKQSNTQEPALRNKIVQITGSCIDPLYVNQFVNNLKMIQGVKTVLLENFTYNKQKETGMFTIELNII